MDMLGFIVVVVDVKLELDVGKVRGDSVLAELVFGHVPFIKDGVSGVGFSDVLERLFEEL